MVFVVSGIKISAPGIRIIGDAPRVSESSAVRPGYPNHRRCAPGIRIIGDASQVSESSTQSENPESRTGLNPGRSPRRNES